MEGLANLPDVLSEFQSDLNHDLSVFSSTTVDFTHHEMSGNDYQCLLFTRLHCKGILTPQLGIIESFRLEEASRII